MKNVFGNFFFQFGSPPPYSVFLVKIPGGFRSKMFFPKIINQKNFLFFFCFCGWKQNKTFLIFFFFCKKTTWNLYQNKNQMVSYLRLSKGKSEKFWQLPLCFRKFVFNFFFLVSFKKKKHQLFVSFTNWFKKIKFQKTWFVFFWFCVLKKKNNIKRKMITVAF